MISQGKFKMEPNCFPSFAASDMHWLHWYPLLPSTSNFLHQKLWHKYKFGCPSPNIVRVLSATSKDISDISNHQKIKLFSSSNLANLDQTLQTWINFGSSWINFGSSYLHKKLKVSTMTSISSPFCNLDSWESTSSHSRTANISGLSGLQMLQRK